MKVSVLGGGGFGRGLAHAAARAKNTVTLWSRTPRDVGNGVVNTQDLGKAVDAELLFVAVPSTHVLETARALRPYVDGSHRVVHVSRGLVGPELVTITRLFREETAVRRVGALGGPLVADALEKGTPSGAIVGTLFPEIAKLVREAIGSATLRIYETDDVVGVESASALVGMLALAAGFAHEIGVGPSALAILCTRGLAEAHRIGHALGGREKTFHGLAGVGDLLAATSGDDRPELKLGRALARGATLEQAGREAGANIEGVTIARRVAEYAARRNVEVPIAATIAELVERKIAPGKAIEALMTREQRVE